MYFQVLVETTEKVGKSKTNKIITLTDIADKEEVINDILVPYLTNKEFIVNGFFLKKENIQRLKISITERSARELSKYENDTMPAGVILYVSPEDILSYDKYITDVTKGFIAEASERIKKGENMAKQHSMSDEKTKVFIVHGHNNEAKLDVARFVEKLGLKVIILHEQPSEGMTIIEKIDEYSDVGFCIVLYTPCDIGYEKNKEGSKKNRARQNVVFEHGYMIGKLGRTNVCALVKGEIETPNDISGIVYINMDASGGWKIPLAKEMKGSGYDIDFNLIM